MNEIDLLARMRAGLPEDPRSLDRARRLLLERAAQEQAVPDPAVAAGRRVGRGAARRPRWAWPLAGVGGLAAAGLAVAVVLGGTPAAPPAGTPAAVQPAGQNVLLLAAERAEQAPAGSGRYWVNRSESGSVSEVGPAGDRYQVVSTGEAAFWIAQRPGEQSWWISRSLGTAPLTDADRKVWERDGRPDHWTVQAGSGKGAIEIPAAAGAPFGNPINDGADVFALGDRNVSLADLAALPADPDRLKAALLDRYDGGGGDLPADRDAWLFQVGSNVVMDMPVSPAVRSAAYRMLAALPGVRDLGAVQDAQGRAGQAVALDERTSSGTLENRLVIDPASGAPLATETRSVGPDGSTRLLDYDLVVGAGYTDDTPPPVG